MKVFDGKRMQLYPKCMGQVSDPATRQTTEATGFDMSLHDFAGGLEDEIFIINSEYQVRFANSAMQHRLPEATGSPNGRHCYEVFQGRDKPCSPPLWKCPLSKVLQSGSSASVIHPYDDKYVKITMWPLKDDQGKIDAVVESRRDVTAERELEVQILRRYHHLDALSRISSAVSGYGI